MRLSKEEYRNAKGCLKRFRYNYIDIMTVKSIPEISAIDYDRLPQGKYTITDTVANSIIRIEDNKSLQKAIKEYNAVIKALEIVDSDSKYIFNHIYNKQDKNKWDIMEDLCISERTYMRRFKSLVYAVANELKK